MSRATHIGADSSDLVRSTCRRLGHVVGKSPLGGMTRIDIQVPGWVQARPGQFALLQARDSGCFLARALSVTDQTGDVVSFLVAAVGRGTRELCSLAIGSELWVLGPLGNGFDVETITADAGRVVLVAGGVGVAPFPLLLSSLVEASDERGHEIEVLVLAGFRTTQQACGGEVLVEPVALATSGGHSCSFETVVEDGSRGRAERVTDALARHVRPGDRVVVCGPEAMAKAVWDVCAQVPGVRVWFSLESNMACGVGSCHGCVITLTDGSLARVCREGPVFSGEEVFGD